MAKHSYVLKQEGEKTKPNYVHRDTTPVKRNTIIEHKVEEKHWKGIH